MRSLIARQKSWGKLLALPLLLGFLIVPFALLPAHGLPGHAATMSKSVSAGTEHNDSNGHANDAESASNNTFVSTDHNGPKHGGPYCDTGSDYSPLAPSRSLTNDSVYLAFLSLALALAVVAAEPFLFRQHWRAYLRLWATKPPWRSAGASFLSFACISRT
ncbi:hypothetical protein GCM10027597_35970 [Saccharopolyspora tripterygii]